MHHIECSLSQVSAFPMLAAQQAVRKALRTLSGNPKPEAQELALLYDLMAVGFDLEEHLDNLTDFNKRREEAALIADPDPAGVSGSLRTHDRRR